MVFNLNKLNLSGGGRRGAGCERDLKAVALTAVVLGDKDARDRTGTLIKACGEGGRRVARVAHVWRHRAEQSGDVRITQLLKGEIGLGEGDRGGRAVKVKGDAVARAARG